MCENLTRKISSCLKWTPFAAVQAPAFHDLKNMNWFPAILKRSQMHKRKECKLWMLFIPHYKKSFDNIPKSLSSMKLIQTGSELNYPYLLVSWLGITTLLRLLEVTCTLYNFGNKDIILTHNYVKIFTTSRSVILHNL